MSSNWTTKQFDHFNKTGETPEDAVKTTMKTERHEQKLEADLQKVSEQWLHHRGYMRLTADNAVNEVPAPCGWYGHLVQAKKNSFLPDLIIFDYMMQRSLMIELKVRNVWQPGQK